MTENILKKDENGKIPSGIAYAYAIKTEIEAIKDYPIDEEKFFLYLNERSSEIGEFLSDNWDSWEEEHDEAEY